MSRGVGSPVFVTPQITPGVKRLLILNVVVYVLFLVALRTPLAWAAEALVFVPRDVLLGQLWQPLTYMFLHSPNDVGHLLFGLLGVFFVGATVERLLGTQKLYLVYLLSGLGGALLALLVGGLGAGLGIAPLAGIWTTPQLGSSGPFLGLLFCMGALMWGQSVNLFGVMQMQVRTLLLLTIGFELLVMLSFSQSGTAVVSFGSMGVGFLLGWYGVPSLAGLRRRAPKPPPRKKSPFQVIEGGSTGKSSEKGDTAGRPIWLHRPGQDDDDPIVH